MRCCVTSGLGLPNSICRLRLHRFGCRSDSDHNGERGQSEGDGSCCLLQAGLLGSGGVDVGHWLDVVVEVVPPMHPPSLFGLAITSLV